MKEGIGTAKTTWTKKTAFGSCWINMRRYNLFPFIFYYLVIMLYRFAWVMMWITFKIFFRRIDLVGLDKLKTGKPAIIIANHPASFLDAMVLAVFLRRSIHFYVRGDIFAHPLAYKVLTMLHMIPIFSREHGIQNLEKNKRTFDRGRKLLEQGKLLLIFPEGFSRQSKQLEPFKKGAARVALQTAFEGGKMNELQIQTVALNYSYHNLGANLLIRLGDAVTLEKFEQQYYEFPAMAITQLNKEMSVAFQHNVIHVEDGKRTDLVEVLLRMFYHEKNMYAKNLFTDFRNICASVNRLSEEEFVELQVKILQYEQLLGDYKITDQAVVDLKHPRIAGKQWYLFCIAPFALLGKLVWGLPAKFSIWIADQTVTRIDFYTSVLSGILGFMGFLWWGLFSITAYVFGNSIILFFSLLLPLFGYLYMQWDYRWKNNSAFMRLKKLCKKEKTVVEQLLELRNQIVTY